MLLDLKEEDNVTLSKFHTAVGIDGWFEMLVRVYEDSFY